MASPIRVFVGTEEAQDVPAAVLRHSITSRTRADVEFADLRGLASGAEGAFYTGFSFYRWAIPKLCGFEGRAIYVDADIVFAHDIEDLWSMAMGEHTHLARPWPERDQSFTSVMLLDCSRLSHWRFDEWAARAKGDLEFYKATMWCREGGPTRAGLGPLPAEWNHLDEWVNSKTKVIHYTKVRDQPWKRPGHPHAHVFLDALRAAVDAGALSREKVADDVRAGFVHPDVGAAVGAVPSGAREPVVAAVERVDACPACGRARSATWCRARDRLLRLSAQEFRYARCGACGAVFASERPTEDDVARFYPEDYGPFVVADGAGEGATPAPGSADGSARREERAPRRASVLRPRRAFKRAVKDFYAGATPGTTFLDYGCGAGAYLDYAKAAGYATVGVDASPVARERAAAKGHLALPDAPSAWGPLADGSVGFVRMNHVLEHLYRPREVLRALAAKMAPGARLHVAVPNPAGWSARAFRSAWHGLDCPRHVVLYPPATLARLLRDEGFTDVAVLHEPLTKDHLRSWGYVLEGLGLRPPGTAESVRNVRLLRRLASPIATASAVAGRGDRIHAFAARARG
jgi:SAM-dependent methyltransferase